MALARDTYAVAHWLANMDGRGTLARCFEPSLSEEKRQATEFKVGFSASGSKRRVASADFPFAIRE